MACDLFCSSKARNLLKGKCVYFFGDSNMRALYKDILWLLESGTLISENSLKTKNEITFANDIRVSNGTIHGGRNYVEIREYKENPFIKFQFITRLFLQEFIDTIMNLKHSPNFVVINSCVWDISRWGVNGVQQFKKNLHDTFDFLKSHLSSASRIIWLTAFPPSFALKGGFLSKEVEFLNSMMPWHVLFANQFASNLAKRFEIDVLDIHYHFRFLLDYHTRDGVHWNSKAIRYATNMLLTHIALISNTKLPGNSIVDELFMFNSQVIAKPRMNKHPNAVSNNKMQMNKNCEASVKNMQPTSNQQNHNSKKRKRRNNRNKLTISKRPCNNNNGTEA